MSTQLAYTWDTSTPTITVISKPNYPVWNIPFPAVTICSLNLISNVHPNNTTIPNDEIIDQIRKVLYYTTSDFYMDEFDKLTALMTFNNITVSEIKRSIAPDCNEMILFCKWKGEVRLCPSYFQKINTSEGICCSFNYYAEPENNFPANIKAQIQNIPHKISGSHYKAGLTVLLDSQIDDYMASYLSSYGFRLFLHDAYDYADENAEIKMLSSNQECFIRVVPEQVKTTQAIRKLPISQRNCYFRDEFKLDFFSNYSFINCVAECRASIMYRICGCIPLRYASNSTSRICSFPQTPCIMNFLTLSQITLENNETINRNCDHCLPNCEFNVYQVDLSSSRLNTSYSISNRLMFKNRTKGNYVILHVFYGDLYTNLYIMDLFQDWISTLATLGGIVGLLSNINLMSIFEFGFYMFLKPFFHIFEDDSDESDAET
ncbi:sodium channel protein Nach-like [Condylostylus longicornis]|uniref:sodium channel protein Nach-like n=1 Tax=Condylostylus longicornis TaxID=2530218 RepID=UPI00244E1952|nr:sodium channel protein Nach-like [Condylostylus longicornis]